MVTELALRGDCRGVFLVIFTGADEGRGQEVVAVIVGGGLGEGLLSTVADGS